MPIIFINNNNDFDNEKIIKSKNIIECIKNEDKELGLIRIIFVNKKEILEINRKYLNHNYFTDIITFNNSFLKVVSGEIYICTAIVKENARIHSNNNFFSELNRVIIHGILHLIGYNDDSYKDKIIMSGKENFYLKMIREK